MTRLTLSNSTRRLPPPALRLPARSRARPLRPPHPSHPQRLPANLTTSGTPGRTRTCISADSHGSFLKRRGLRFLRLNGSSKTLPSRRRYRNTPRSRPMTPTTLPTPRSLHVTKLPANGCSRHTSRRACSSRTASVTRITRFASARMASESWQESCPGFLFESPLAIGRAW